MLSHLLLACHHDIPFPESKVGLAILALCYLGKQQTTLQAIEKIEQKLTAHEFKKFKSFKRIIFKAIQNENSISIIHNAGIAQPSLINALPEELLHEHFETNYFAPILLTQQLLPLLKKHSRVLHISSGAADLALAGLMPYCTSKAALERATHCFNQELNSQEIYFANLRPGMVDTNMQKKLRENNESDLPNRDFYLDAKKNNNLIPPQIAAEFIFWVMTNTTNDDFSKTLWNIYDLKYREQWYQKDFAKNWGF